MAEEKTFDEFEIEETNSFDEDLQLAENKDNEEEEKDRWAGTM